MISRPQGLPRVGHCTRALLMMHVTEREKESNQPWAWGKRSKWENAISDCTIKRQVSGILSPNQVPGNEFL